MEITSGIFKAAGNIYQNNKGSILRTIIYTIGHFAIAITVLMLVADVSFMIALTDAIVEPIACLLYTSPSPRDRQKSRMPSSA